VALPASLGPVCASESLIVGSVSRSLPRGGVGAGMGDSGSEEGQVGEKLRGEDAAKVGPARCLGEGELLIRQQ
jgi:hypothetical protein